MSRSRATASQLVYKQPAETLYVEVDFVNWIDTGVTLSNPVVTDIIDGGGASDLDISGETIVGDDAVGFYVADGTDATRYRLEVQVDTSDSQVLALDVIIKVTDS